MGQGLKQGHLHDEIKKYMCNYTVCYIYSTSIDRYANVDVGVLLYHIERFPGIVILTTNLIDNIDKAFFRRLKFVLLFDIPPRALRIKLWKVYFFCLDQQFLITFYSCYCLKKPQ